MVHTVRAELLTLIQASLGWAVLAARAVDLPRKAPVALPLEARGSPARGETPVRLRATITIDIDARDAEEAERVTDAIRSGFAPLKRAHPEAELTVQRRRPRSAPRSPSPTLVVAPYLDD